MNAVAEMIVATSEVPDEWRLTRLGDVARSFAGGTPSRSKPEYYGGDIPWLKSGEVRAGRIEAVEEHITEQGLRESSARIAKAGTPVIAMYGATAGVAGILGIDAAMNQAVLAVEPSWDNLDGEFCFYLLDMAGTRLLTMTQGSGQPNLSKGLIDGLEILLPPLDEQRRIAEVLRSVDDAIAANTALLEGVKAAKQGTMDAILSGGFGEVRLETLLADTRYPMRSGPFGSALLKSELQPEGIPFLGIDNVHVERFVPVYRRFVSDEKYRELARYTVYPGDVMVTIMGTVGRCCVVPPGVGTAISSKHVWTLTLDQGRYSPALLAWQINHSPPVLEQLQGSAQGGIMSAISSGTLRDLLVPLPSPAEVREIEGLLLSFNNQIAALEAEQDAVSAMKAALMSDLLSGHVRVPA